MFGNRESPEKMANPVRWVHLDPEATLVKMAEWECKDRPVYLGLMDHGDHLDRLVLEDFRCDWILQR